MRNRLFRKSCARTCQEIEEIRRICWEGTDRARHLKFWWIVCAGILVLWVNSWLSFRIYLTRWIPCQVQEIFTILKQRAALERPTFPVNSWPFRVWEERPAAILDCRLTHGILRVLQEEFFESLPIRDGPSSALFENSRNLASSSRRYRPDIAGNTLEHERGVRWEPQSSSIPAPQFQTGSGILNHTGGTHSHIGMMD